MEYEDRRPEHMRKPKEWFGRFQERERRDARQDAEKLALRLLRGSDLARHAIEEQWAPALLGFVEEHGRLPNWPEQDDLVAKSRANDALVRDFVDAPDPWAQLRGMPKVADVLGPKLRDLRAAMHAKAERLLGQRAE